MKVTHSSHNKTTVRPDISAIVVNYKTPDLTNKAIESIFANSPEISREVIVVDNASGDGSAGIIKERWGDQVVLLENKENLGFAKANNQAFIRAKGRYFFLLNSDAELIGDSLEKMVRFADDNPEIGILGCKVLSDTGQQQLSCWRTYNLTYLFCRALNIYRFLPDGFLGSTNIEKYGKPKENTPVEVVSGCAMLVSREAVEQAGFFDERFFMYCEDTDWCTRMRRARFGVYFLSDASVLHHECGTSTYMFVEMKIEQSRSLLHFMRKQYGIFHVLLANIYLGLFFLIRLPYWVLMSLAGNRKQQAQRMAKSYFTAFCWHAFWPMFSR